MCIYTRNRVRQKEAPAIVLNLDKGGAVPLLRVVVDHAALKCARGGLDVVIDGPSEVVGTSANVELGEKQFVRVCEGVVLDTEELRVGLLAVELDLVVAAVLALGPLEVTVDVDEELGALSVLFGGEVAAVGGRGGDSGAAEFDGDRAATSSRVVGIRVVHPLLVNGVKNPVGVRVTSNENRVVNLVLCKRVEEASSVLIVSIPSIVVVGERRRSLGNWVDNNLLSDDLPYGTTLLRLDNVAVQPSLLLGAHQTAVCVVRDGLNLGSVVVHVGDVTTEASVKHENVSQSAVLERSPDSQRVGRVDLADGHPLKVGLDGVPLALSKVDSLNGASLGVVRVGAAMRVGVVSELMIIPDGKDSMSTVEVLKTRVVAVRLVSSTVVLEGEDFLVGLGDSANSASISVRIRATVAGALVNVVTDVEPKVDVVLVASLLVSVEEAPGKIGAGEDGETERVDIVVVVLWERLERTNGGDEGVIVAREEPVVVLSLGLETGGLNLEAVVYVRSGPGVVVVNYIVLGPVVLALGGLVSETDGLVRLLSGHGVGPENGRVRVRVARGNVEGERDVALVRIATVRAIFAVVVLHQRLGDVSSTSLDLACYALVVSSLVDSTTNGTNVMAQSVRSNRLGGRAVSNVPL